MAGTSDDELEWFEELEKRIAAVTSELTELRKKNRSLLAKTQRLERRAREDSSSSEADWGKEKQQIRKRVEKLSRGLEALLDS